MTDTSHTVDTRIRPAWTAYAALLTFCVLAGEARNVSLARSVTALTLANWALSAALLTALWGYALRRTMGNPRYWRSVFWLVLAANLVMLVPVLLAGPEIALYTGALTLAIVPAYVAAWRYAYRSPELWAAR